MSRPDFGRMSFGFEGQRWFTHFPSCMHACILINIKLEMHIEILGHTPVARNFQNTNKWREKTLNSVALYPEVKWVAFAQGVARWGMLWLLIFLQHKYDCTSHFSVRQVEHSPPQPSPPRKSKVSWTKAQINATFDPAGLVSGSPGQRGQTCLCPEGAVCGSVS